MKNIRILAVFTAFIMGGSISALTFEDISSAVNETYDVKAALLQTENAKKTVALSKIPGDLSFSISPSVKTTTADGADFADAVEYYGISSVKIPTGLSDEEKEKVSFLEDDLAIAGLNVSEAKRKAFITVHRLYQEAWLLQEEREVLLAELDAVQTRVDILSQQYRNGSISLTVLSEAEEDLADKEEELSQKLLNEKLTLYELAFTVNRDVKEETLEKFELDMEKLPSPPVLTTWATDNHPDLIAQKYKVKQIKTTYTRMAKPDLDISVSPFFSSDDYSVSAEYSFSDPMLSLAYSFPVYTQGTLPYSTKEDDTWSMGLSVELSFSSGKTDTKNMDLLKIEEKQEEARLQYLIDYTSLKIRSSYQEYLKALDSLKQAKRDLKRDMDNRKIVETRASLGQAFDYEIKESDALVKRAEWDVENARVAVEEAYLNTAYTASWGDFYE